MCRILIGERILEYRRRHGINQRKFGEMLGVTSQAVSKWERDVCCPDISLLPELAKILEVKIQDLFK
ncbi:MAG: helix-turn-helix transcriptional regulator [Ruminococcaceae bacterium]|nr:helix-turn-helix transcriptional regulator [Oscillospiraceae bacterium]